MRARFAGRHDVLGDNAVRQEIVADESAVAAPVDGFRTHVGRDFLLREAEQLLDAVAKVVGGHVVGVVAEAFITERGVWGFGRLLAPAPSSEAFEPNVIDAGFIKAGREGFAVEVRIFSRAGEAADIGQALDAVPREEGEERFEGKRGVTDRIDGVLKVHGEPSG